MRIALPCELRDLAYLAGELGSSPSDRLMGEVGGIATDSREVLPGDLFVAIKGEHYDGNCFARKAFAAGAVAVLSDVADIGQTAGPVLWVKEVKSALLRAAERHRKRLGAHVTAVSGSSGKTTVKEAVAALLSSRYRVEKSAGNFNSTVGMPLSLLSMGGGTHLVLELGINRVGEMEALSRACSPDLAILTNVGTAHIGNFGDYTTLLFEKAALGKHVMSNGAFLVPYELPPAFFEQTPATLYRMGEQSRADFRAEKIVNCSKYVGADLVCPDRVITNLKWPIPGRVGVSNILAVGAVGYLMGLEDEAIRRGLSLAGQSTPRARAIEVGERILIDDTYNASPEAVIGAIESLSLRAGGRPCVAVLGDMLELGEYAAPLHEAVGEAAAGAGLAQLFLYGTEATSSLARGARRGGMPEQSIHCFERSEREALCEAVCRLVPHRAAVLFKGSFAMGLSGALEEVRRRFEE